MRAEEHISTRVGELEIYPFNLCALQLEFLGAQLAERVWTARRADDQSTQLLIIVL